MATHWDDVWGGGGGGDDVSARLAMQNPEAADDSYVKPDDVVRDPVLREVLALRREQAQRHSMTMVGGLLLAAVVLSYVDGLRSEVRKLREEVARRGSMCL